MPPKSLIKRPDNSKTQTATTPSINLTISKPNQKGNTAPINQIPPIKSKSSFNFNASSYIPKATPPVTSKSLNIPNSNTNSTAQTSFNTKSQISKQIPQANKSQFFTNQYEQPMEYMDYEDEQPSQYTNYEDEQPSQYTNYENEEPSQYTNYENEEPMNIYYENEEPTQYTNYENEEPMNIYYENEEPTQYTNYENEEPMNIYYENDKLFYYDENLLDVNYQYIGERTEPDIKERVESGDIKFLTEDISGTIWTEKLKKSDFYLLYSFIYYGFFYSKKNKSKKKIEQDEEFNNFFKFFQDNVNLIIKRDPNKYFEVLDVINIFHNSNTEYLKKIADSKDQKYNDEKEKLIIGKYEFKKLLDLKDIKYYFDFVGFPLYKEQDLKDREELKTIELYKKFKFNFASDVHKLLFNNEYGIIKILDTIIKILGTVQKIHDEYVDYDRNDFSVFNINLYLDIFDFQNVNDIKIPTSKYDTETFYDLINDFINRAGPDIYNRKVMIKDKRRKRIFLAEKNYFKARVNELYSLQQQINRYRFRGKPIGSYTLKELNKYIENLYYFTYDNYFDIFINYYDNVALIENGMKMILWRQFYKRTEIFFYRDNKIENIEKAEFIQRYKNGIKDEYEMVIDKKLHENNRELYVENLSNNDTLKLIQKKIKNIIDKKEKYNKALEDFIISYNKIIEEKIRESLNDMLILNFITRYETNYIEKDVIDKILKSLNDDDPIDNLIKDNNIIVNDEELKFLIDRSNNAKSDDINKIFPDNVKIEDFYKPVFDNEYKKKITKKIQAAYEDLYKFDTIKNAIKKITNFLIEFNIEINNNTIEYHDDETMNDKIKIVIDSIINNQFNREIIKMRFKEIYNQELYNSRKTEEIKLLEKTEKLINQVNSYDSVKLNYQINLYVKNQKIEIIHANKKKKIQEEKDKEKLKKMKIKNYYDAIQREYLFYDKTNERCKRPNYLRVDEKNPLLNPEFKKQNNIIDSDVSMLGFDDLYRKYKNHEKFLILDQTNYIFLNEINIYNDIKYVDETFKKLDDEEKKYLSYCFCYLKNQIKFYIQGSSAEHKKDNKKINEKINLEAHNQEILLFIMPFIKDFSKIQNIKNLSDIFVKSEIGDKFIYSNMNYNLCSINKNLKLSTFEEIKNYLADQIIIFLNTLEKSFCRLMVNWYNIHPLYLRLNNQYTGDNILIMNDMQIFKNTMYEIIGKNVIINSVDRLNHLLTDKNFNLSNPKYRRYYTDDENEKIEQKYKQKIPGVEYRNYKSSKFYINYSNIRNKILNMDSEILNQNFLNNVFPISSLYNALYYYPSLKDIFYTPDTNFIIEKIKGKDKNISQSPIFNNYSMHYLLKKENEINNNKFKFWDSLTDEEKHEFFLFLTSNNSNYPKVDLYYVQTENKFKFLLSLMFYTGTLSCIYKNKEFDKEKYDYYSNIDYKNTMNIFYQFEKDPHYLNFRDCHFFLNNMNYEDLNIYFKNLLTAENNIYNQKLTINKKNKTMIKVREFKHMPYVKTDSIGINLNLLSNRYIPGKWKKSTNGQKSENNILYSAELLAQLSVYNKFINCRVSFITGDTGTGKSTQFPILILYGLKAFDYNVSGTIIDTQPRRNAVKNNANAVSSFLGLFVPICYFNKNVQYQTGDTDIHYDRDNIYKNELKIKFVTDKILLNMLNKTILLKGGLKDSEEKDKMKNIFDVIIVDEAHEHNINMDFILTIMRNITYINNSIRLMIVSATMDDDEPRYRQYYRFIEDLTKYPLNRMYYENKIKLSELDRRINVSNPIKKTYKIEDNFIDDDKIKFLNLVNTNEFDIKKDKDKIELTNNQNVLKILNYEIENNKESKNFLVFKSGEKEINDCIDYLLQNGLNKSAFVIPWLRNANLGILNILDICQKENIVNLIHIDRTAKLADIVDYHDFYEGPNRYKHIIFVATNIVEASVTINALTHVIDDGFQKTASYDYNSGNTEIIKSYISNQSRIQRRGRVGRIEDGWVYYLYTYAFIKDNKVIYKICNENISELYFNLLQTDNFEISETNKILNLSISLFNDPSYLNINSLNDIQKINYYIYDATDDVYYEFNYRKFLKIYYKQIYELNAPKYGMRRNYYDENNNSFEPFYFIPNKKADNKLEVYNSSGLNYNILNDNTYSYYIIHPREKYIKYRSLIGEPMFRNPKDNIKVNYIIYCQRYFFNMLVKYDKKTDNFIRTRFYDKFAFIFRKFIYIIGYDTINDYIYNVILMMILSYHYNCYEEMIKFFYCLYFYFQAPTVNKFICLPNQYITDYEYLKDHLKHKEKRTKDEEFLSNSIEELNVFREEIFNNESIIKTIKDCEEFIINQINIHETINFNKILVLCFGGNLIKSYENHYATERYNLNIYPQNKYFYVDVMTPTDHIIKLDIEHSVYKTFDNPQVHKYLIYFDRTYTETTHYVKFVYPVSTEDLNVLKYYFIFRQQLHKEKGPYDYLLNIIIKEKDEFKKKEYQKILNDIKNVMKNGYAVFDYKKI